MNTSISSLQKGPIPIQVLVGTPPNSVKPQSVIKAQGISERSDVIFSYKFNNFSSLSIPTTILVKIPFIL